MPVYSFRNRDTGEEYELTLSMSEREEYLAANPNVEQFIGRAPSIGDSIKLGLKKPDGWFRDRLKDIKKSHRGSDINTI